MQRHFPLWDTITQSDLGGIKCQDLMSWTCEAATFLRTALELSPERQAGLETFGMLTDNRC